MSCLAFLLPLLSQTDSPDIKLTSKRWDFCHSWEPDIVLFGFPEWFSKWFMVTWRQMCLMFASSWWFIGSLMLLFSPSTGGWVALRWVYQGSLLQPWKVWGEFKWCLSISNVTLWYCFIRHLALCWEKQVSVLVLLKLENPILCQRCTSWIRFLLWRYLICFN